MVEVSRKQLEEAVRKVGNSAAANSDMDALGSQIACHRSARMR